MRLPSIILLSAIVVAACSHNRYDKAHRRHGWWVTCYDSLCRQPATKGRFRHGRESGTWRFYNSDGNLVKREIYTNRGKFMKVRMYHENGRVACRGQARLLPSSDGMHYYWSGPWLFFDEKGAQLYTDHYEFGRVVRTDSVRRNSN